MIFTTLTEDEFRKFSESHPQESFFQTVETAKLRESYGSIIHYLGVKKDNKIIAGGMFTETPCLFGKKRFYSPQGFLIDYHDFDLLKFFVTNLKKYAKAHKAMFLKIDPNVNYRIRSSEGEILDNDVKDDESINNLKKLGFKHFGFTKDYRFSQSRWNYRLKLDIPYEEAKKKFSKSTRKNIDNMYDLGVRVRRGKEEDLEIMTELLKSTAERKHFRYRTLEYYTRMYKYFGDLMHIYIAYLDTNLYLDYVNRSIDEEEKKLAETKHKMEKDMVGAKLKTSLDTSLRKIEKYKNDLKEAKELNEKYPNGLDIGALLSIKSGKEYITHTSGVPEQYKKYMPKYVLYNEHILDSYKLGFQYANFYGIDGIFNKSSLVYGVYEFKRGFNGEVQELIGEFTLKISNTYYIYKLFRYLKILYRKIIKR